MKSDYERLKTGLCEAISILCKNGLHFQSELSVEGLLGITLDHNEVFLVNIKEIIRNATDPYHYTPKPRDHQREPQGFDANHKNEDWPEDHLPMDVAHVARVLPHPAHSQINFLRRSSSRERPHRRKHNPMKVVNIPYSDEEIDLTYRTLNATTEATDLSKKEPSSKFSNVSSQNTGEDSVLTHNEKNVYQKVGQSHQDNPCKHSAAATASVSCTDSEEASPNELYSSPAKVTQESALGLTCDSDATEIRSNDDRETNNLFVVSGHLTKEDADEINMIKTELDADSHKDVEAEECLSMKTDYETDYAEQTVANTEETKEKSGSSKRFANSLIRAQLEGRISEVTLRNSINEESESPFNLPGSSHQSDDSPLSMLENDEEGGALVIVKEESSEEVEVIEGESGDCNLQGRESLHYLGSSSHAHPGLGIVLGNMSMPVFPGVFPQDIGTSSSGPMSLAMPLKIPQSPLVSGGLWTPPIADESSCSSSNHGNPGNGNLKSEMNTSGAHSSRSQSLIRTPHLQKRRGFQCINCGTSVTTMWRRDEEGRPVCNPCGLYYKLHQKQRPLSLTVRTPQARRRKSPGSKIKMIVPGSSSNSSSDAPMKPNTSTDALS